MLIHWIFIFPYFVDLSQLIYRFSNLFSSVSLPLSVRHSPKAVAILNEYYMVRYGALHDAIRVNEKERESGRGYEQVNKIIYFFMVLFVHE